MLEYAPVPRIERRGIYKNKIVWLQHFRAITRKQNLDIVRNFAKSCQLTKIRLFACGAVLISNLLSNLYCFSPNVYPSCYRQSNMDCSIYIARSCILLVRKSQISLTLVFLDSYISKRGTHAYTVYLSRLTVKLKHIIFFFLMFHTRSF